MNVNVKSGLGQTPLMIACNFHNNHIAKLLLDKGAEMDTQDNFGFNAFLYAVKENNHVMVIYLIHKGCLF